MPPWIHTISDTKHGATARKITHDDIKREDTIPNQLNVSQICRNVNICSRRAARMMSQPHQKRINDRGYGFVHYPASSNCTLSRTECIKTEFDLPPNATPRSFGRFT